MTRAGRMGLAAGAMALAAMGAWGQAAKPAGVTPESQKKVEQYLRSNFALGPEITITIGTPVELGSSGLMELPIEVKTPEGTEKVKMYLSKDGRYLIRGEVNDLSKDPLAENVSKISLANAPVLGDPKAPITLVEFSDFECPVCRNLHDALRGMLPNYPQVKVVFKDFPIEQLHPWARTAALAGRCAYQQNPAAFWKLYDLIYDNQELITASDAYERMLEYAGKAGLNVPTFKSCLSSAQAAAEVDASVENGKLLDVHSTPTIFVNGRRVVGADARTIQQFIDFELAAMKGKK